MALKINEVKSIIIKNPGKANESIKVIYELGTTENSNLVKTGFLGLVVTGTDNLNKIKSDAMTESKKKYGII